MVDRRDSILLPGLRGHPRALPAGRRDRRDGAGAARLARPAHAARGGQDGRPRSRPADGAAVRPRAGRQRHDDRARVRRRTSRAPRRRCSRRPSGPGLRIASGSSSPTATCARTSRSRPSAPTARATRADERWHGRGRLRYAVTPRFSVSCTEPMLEACRRTARRDAGPPLFTSHVNENPSEIAFVTELFPGRGTTSTPMSRQGCCATAGARPRRPRLRRRAAPPRRGPDQHRPLPVERTRSWRRGSST